ncbi:MAG: amidase, partial [bacterium]|nr:amidase [bacterium]
MRPSPFEPIAQLAPRIAAGEVRPSELVEACLRRIADKDAEINAFITPAFDMAREAAAAREAEIARGEVRGPLHGIPFAIKDLFDLEGLPMTAGSKILKDNISASTATSVQRLIAAGAVIVGKTNLQEFARGGTGADSFFGPTRNPWDLDRSPGGSTSGS